MHFTGGEMPRRTAMARGSALVSAIWALAAALGGAVAALVGGFLSNSWGVRREPTRITVARWEDLDDRDFLRLVLPVTQRHGWTTRTLQRTIYLRRGPEGEPLAFLATCSHMGCQVSWESAEESFRCPCHEGRFDAQGAVMSGPPPQGLRSVEASVEDGQVLVKLA